MRKDLPKKKGIAITDAPGSAQISLEVLERGVKETSTRNYGFGRMTAERKDTILVRLSSGDYHVDMESQNRFSSGPGPEKYVIQAVEQWVKDNRDKLAR